MLEKYPDVLTVEELKEILRYNSSTTIYKILKEGKIQSIHAKGNRYLIPKVSVIKYLQGK